MKEMRNPTFAPVRQPSKQRKLWLRSLRCSGTIELDNGAVEAIQPRKNVYAVGNSCILGSFLHMSAVRLVDHNGVELDSGLSNYLSVDLKEVRGKNSVQIKSMGLGFSGPAVHRKNLAADFLRNMVGVADDKEPDPSSDHPAEKIVTYFEK